MSIVGLLFFCFSTTCFGVDYVDFSSQHRSGEDRMGCNDCQPRECGSDQSGVMLSEDNEFLSDEDLNFFVGFSRSQGCKYSKRFHKCAIENLFAAAESGSVPTIAVTLRNNKSVSVDPVDEKTGDTPLHLAARFGKIKVVQLMVALGARNACNDKKLYAVDLAREGEHKKVVEILSEHGYGS